MSPGPALHNTGPSVSSVRCSEVQSDNAAPVARCNAIIECLWKPFYFRHAHNQPPGFFPRYKCCLRRGLRTPTLLHAREGEL